MYPLYQCKLKWCLNSKCTCGYIASWQLLAIILKQNKFLDNLLSDVPMCKSLDEQNLSQSEQNGHLVLLQLKATKIDTEREFAVLIKEKKLW